MSVQVLVAADKTIERVISQQKIEDIPYRISSLVISEGNLLHNTLNGELLRYDELENGLQGLVIRQVHSIKELINHGIDTGKKVQTLNKQTGNTTKNIGKESEITTKDFTDENEIIQENTNAVFSIIDDANVNDIDISELIRKHYLVPIDTDEVKLCSQLRDIMGLLAPSKVRNFTILPTTCCNARCFYCYEADISKHSMTDETADRVIEYIRNHSGVSAKSTESGGTSQSNNSDSSGCKLNITWFGGEPLVGIRQIDRICEGISDLDFSSKMISNGFLFDESVINKAKNLWHLKEVQITLDGTEEVYNRTKNYYDSSESPFRRVMNNIKLLTEAEIKVDLRMNVGKYNVDDLKELIGQLEVFKGDYFYPYVHVIFDEASEEMDRKCEELETLLVDKGMKKPGRKLCKLKSNNCMADADSCYVINPDGDLTKCEHYAYDEIVGSIDDGVDKSKLPAWKKYSVPKICEDCPLLPSCILLDKCPNAKPCSPFEKANRIEKTKITMRELARKYDEEHQ